MYGELGRCPLSITILARMIKFGGKIACSDKPIKLCHQLYKISFCIYRKVYDKVQKDGWMQCINSTLDSLGTSEIWQNQTFSNLKWLRCTVKQRLADQFIQKWLNDVDTTSSSIGKFYRSFKSQIKFENYLVVLPTFNKKIFTKLRMSLLKLPVAIQRCRNNLVFGTAIQMKQ